MDYGRNIGSWAPAEVDKLVRKGDPVLVPMEVYKEWYDKLSLKIRTEMENKWGKPEESELMVWKDSSGKSYFVIPVVKYGNIILTPQPPRGWEDNAKSLYHDPLVPPLISIWLIIFFEVWLSRRCTGAYRYSRHA